VRRLGFYQQRLQGGHNDMARNDANVTLDSVNVEKVVHSTSTAAM
jgi:predicted RNA binding protein YcfA (HicA-like mRNA interferase family)